MPIDLGQITFGIGADTTRLRASIGDITTFGAAVTTAATSAATAGTAVETAFRKQEAAMVSALQKVQKYQDAVGRLSAPTQLTAGLNQLSTRGLDQLVQRMTMGQLSAIQFQREMERFNVTMNNAQRIMTNWADAQKRAEASSMVASLQKLSGAAVLVAGPLSGIATRISVLANLADHFSLAWAGAIAGVAAGTYAFYKFTQQTITTERQLQQITSTLQAVYGSITIANLQLSYLTDLSNKTGISFATLAKQYSQVEAAAKGTSLEGERIQKVFEAIVFAGAKLGLSNEEVEGSLKAIQQMISKGTIQMEELKGQLGDRLPGAVQIMAKALDLTVPKLNTMIKQGDLGASSLTKFADALVKRYNIDTSAKIDTITAAENRLQTARMTMVDSLDKLIGVSSAYKNLLNLVADGLSGASANSREFVKSMLQAGVALATAFAAPMVIGGISSITFGIANLTRGLWALNAASAAGAFTSFLKLFATAAIAIAAFYGSESLIDKAMAKTNESFMKATPAVEDYIKAQQTLATSVRGPTKDYIKQQEDILSAQQKQREELVQQGVVVEAWQKQMEDAGASADKMQALFESMGGPGIVNRLRGVDTSIEKTKANIASLTDILKKQSAEEDKPRPDPIKDLTTRQTTTIEKANEQIRDLNEKYKALFAAPAQKQFLDTQEEVNHGIQTFKENLERAEIPAAKIKTLVADYGKAFKAFKEGENAVKNLTSAFQAWAEVMGRAGTTALSNFVDVLVDGKDKMLALSDTAKAVAKDILNTFLKLAALNPLKNFLFGTNESVLGGSGGIGGALGGLLGGSSSTKTGTVNVGEYNMPTIGFAKGGIMTSMGSLPLRKYSGGGIANSPQLAMFGEAGRREAYVPLPDGRRIPVAMSGGGNSGGVEVHVHPPSGHQLDQQQSTGANGNLKLDFMFTRMARQAIMTDISTGGPMSRSMEKQYGLNRTKGLTS
jgi:tape measure domain-containing protein